MTIFNYALRANSNNKLNFILICILPFPLLLIPPNDGSLPFGIYLYGMLLFYSSFLLSRPVIEDRMRGLIVRIAASPVSTFKYLGSHLAAYFLLIGLQILLFIGGSILVHHLKAVFYLQLVLLYLSFTIMGIAFSLAWSSIFRSFNLSFGLFAGGASLMCLVSGISMPLAMIPDSVQRLVMFLPTYWLPYGIRALEQADSAGLIMAHTLLLAYGSVFFLAGTKRSLH